MIHPYSYWKQEHLNRVIEVIWCGRNPLLWWAILPAVVIAGACAWSERILAWGFLAVGYAIYLLMWIPVRRYLFIYSYLPAEYLGVLALAGALARCWKGAASGWILLLPLAPTLVLGCRVGLAVCAIIAIALFNYRMSRRSPILSGRFVCLTPAGGMALLFVYFLPLWVDLPLSQNAYASRMWLHSSGLASWL
jgi:dolichyl-phosphate-mannose--protein O-mannosyl transferase